MEQILDVPVPETVKQLVEVPETISEDSIQQQIVKHTFGIPVPQVMEELVEFSKVFPQDRVQQSSADQTIETPAISLAEMPVTQMREETKQVVNTHVQHVVNAVEAEKPIINEKIN